MICYLLQIYTKRFQKSQLTEIVNYESNGTLSSLDLASESVFVYVPDRRACLGNIGAH